MSYLIAKKINETGCIAIRVEHGKPLADFTRHLGMRLDFIRRNFAAE